MGSPILSVCLSKGFYGRSCAICMVSVSCADMQCGVACSEYATLGPL
jgi:hypothetical protein